MDSSQSSHVISVLQISIGPVILISGVGLLLLSMTNRFGRAIDRSRQLKSDLRRADESEKASLRDQIENLYHRARVIRTSITLASISILLVAFLIIGLFATELLHIESGLPALIALFVLSMICLIGSLLAFIHDVHLSLTALDRELGKDPAHCQRDTD